MPVGIQEFLDIGATGREFTLKCVRDMIKTYSKRDHYFLSVSRVEQMNGFAVHLVFLLE